jgi:hypothetical protein
MVGPALRKERKVSIRITFARQRTEQENKYLVALTPKARGRRG